MLLMSIGRSSTKLDVMRHYSVISFIFLALALGVISTESPATSATYATVSVQAEPLIEHVRISAPAVADEFAEQIGLAMAQSKTMRGGAVDDALALPICAALAMEQGKLEAESFLRTINEEGWISGRIGHLGPTRVEYQVTDRYRVPALERRYVLERPQGKKKGVRFVSWLRCSDKRPEDR